MQIIAESSPYADATVLVLTHKKLLKVASESTHGGFGAVLRVALTRVDGETQVANTNPIYWFHVMRLKESEAGMADALAQQLETALGKLDTFGAEQAEELDELREYQYKWGMPEFDEPAELIKHDSYEQALEFVETGLEQQKGGVSKVYRLDIPGKQETVFGVKMTEKYSSDQLLMSLIDVANVRSTPHLPYELMVTDNKVIILDAKFRIAISFPSLSMMGANSFMEIMDAPGDIEEALTLVSGGKP